MSPHDAETGPGRHRSRRFRAPGQSARVDPARDSGADIALRSDLPYHQERVPPHAVGGVAPNATRMTDTVTTDQLYQTDSFLRDFDARVVAVDPERHGAVLDRTALYPGGGGQPADHGTLAWDGASATVTGSRRDGAAIVHLLDPGAPLPQIGSEVHGEIDWERRYALMRMHTALHILCGVVFRDYGALVTGGNMEPDHARMDFEMDSAEFTPERVAEIGARANAEVAAARDVRVAILPRDEAMRIPDLIRTKINLLPEGITDIRTVEIVGLDLQADGGTHVANTREVGGIAITGTRSKGRINKRITIALTEPPTGA